MGKYGHIVILSEKRERRRYIIHHLLLLVIVVVDKDPVGDGDYFLNYSILQPAVAILGENVIGLKYSYDL